MEQVNALATLNGQPIEMEDRTKAIVKNGRKISIVEFAADRWGASLREHKKVNSNGNTVNPSLKELGEALGATKEDIKGIRKQYDRCRESFYQDSAKINALAAADPSLRKESRVDFNKDGKFVGVTTRYRVDHKSAATRAEAAEARAAKAEARLAELEAMMAALTNGQAE